MDLAKLYLDTNMWNRLHEQRVDAHRFHSTLKKHGASLAISGQTLCELARTFEKDPQKGAELFECLKDYVNLGIIAAHDNMEQIHGEIRALNTGEAQVIAFYGTAEYAQLQSEVDKLAQGIFDETARTFIAGRRQFAKTSRADQVHHFTLRSEVKDRLNCVAIQDLGQWLEKELLSDQGTLMLTAHLLRMYDNLPPLTAKRNAHALLRVPASRIAKGIVKADLYCNWRCATRGSNPPDLIDDVYHVLNASYCDVYATAEPKQIEYASLLLSRHTKVAIYTGDIPVDEWLLAPLSTNHERGEDRNDQHQTDKLTVAAT